LLPVRFRKFERALHLRFQSWAVLLFAEVDKARLQDPGLVDGGFIGGWKQSGEI
jgi:hypothetical protein